MTPKKAALLNQAMQSLRDWGWRLEWIGHAFRVHKSTVCRRIQKADAERFKKGGDDRSGECRRSVRCAGDAGAERIVPGPGERVRER